MTHPTPYMHPPLDNIAASLLQLTSIWAGGSENVVPMFLLCRIVFGTCKPMIYTLFCPG